MDYMSKHNSISEDEYFLFRDYIADSCGIFIPPEKSYLLETRLIGPMLEVGIESFSEFHKYITSNLGSPIHQKIINSITTNETLWFRDASPWKVIEEEYLPKLVEQLLSGEKKRVRIWCTAVSTGQEAYSTAMCVENYLSMNNIKDIDLSSFDFFATDVSSRVLSVAKRGRYDSISIMRGLSDYYREKYFIKNESVWEIDPKIREAVRFENFNLKDSFKLFGKFDIIFCRYVLIYFTDELKRQIVEKMHDVLTDDGVLFTGNYALFDLFKDMFTVNHYDNMTYYTRG